MPRRLSRCRRGVGNGSEGVCTDGSEKTGNVAARLSTSDWTSCACAPVCSSCTCSLVQWAAAASLANLDDPVRDRHGQLEHLEMRHQRPGWIRSHLSVHKHLRA